jgi:uncharacterized protein (TIGR03792 family)
MNRVWKQLLSVLFAILLAALAAAAPAAALRALDAGSGVVEVLQMPVKAEQQACWLQAETEVWEPWLEHQQGYRGRELLWDPQRLQAVVLVGWANQASWDAIPAAAIAATEQRFNQQLRSCLNSDALTPLPLQWAGSMQSLSAAQR